MKINYYLKAISIISILSISSCQKEMILKQLNSENESSTENILNSPVQNDNRVYVENELLIKFVPGINLNTKNEILLKISGKIKEHIYTNAMKNSGLIEGIYLINTPINALEALNRVRGLGVEYAEPNYIYNHCATSNDSYYTNGSLWGMYGDATSPTNIYGCQAGEAWANNHIGSSSVYVGIIDEGYMYTHSDIAANAGMNPGEISGNKKDDDGNGLIDDVYGWDFANNDNTVFDGASDDHGTHVAGTIGAIGGNNKGVAGVCWNVKILNAKFLGKNGGTTANAVKSVDYFTNLKKAGLNIVATNNSWGGGGYSQSLYDAIERANNAGILFIAAAGNSGTNNDATPSYPASYSNSNIIAVAAITSSGSLASFSQYGANSVDIGAPGSGIYSTIPKSSKGKVVESYSSYSGTSMATPHVTGAAALYAASNYGASVSTIKAAILNSAVYTSSLSGKCSTNGRLNVSGF